MSIQKRLEKLQGRQSGASFARQCGIKPGTMARYLNGTSKPKMGTIEQIADIFEVSPAWLATGEKAYQPPLGDQLHFQLGGDNSVNQSMVGGRNNTQAGGTVIHPPHPFDEIILEIAEMWKEHASMAELKKIKAELIGRAKG